MEDARNNNILKSPLYDFIQDGWLDWVPDIKVTKVDEKHLLLFVMWGLDSIKEQGRRTNDKFWHLLYNGIRNRLRSEGVQSDIGIDHLADLVCACALHCFGLVLVGNSENQKIFGELIDGLREHYGPVFQLKSEIKAEVPSLKEWLTEYMNNDSYYTLSSEVKWDDERVAMLPDLKRGGTDVPQVAFTQVNIGTLHNHPGAEFNDNSVTIGLQKK